MLYLAARSAWGAFGFEPEGVSLFDRLVFGSQAATNLGVTAVGGAVLLGALAFVPLSKLPRVTVGLVAVVAVWTIAASTLGILGIAVDDTFNSADGASLFSAVCIFGSSGIAAAGLLVVARIRGSAAEASVQSAGLSEEL